MNISKDYQDGWKIFSKNWINAIIGYIIVILISCLTIGILYPAMRTGYNLMLLKAKRGKKISVNDVFSAMNRWLELLGLQLYSGLLIALLAITIIGIFPAILVGTWWMYSGMYLADKKMSITEAMHASKNTVRKNNVWMHLLFLMIYLFLAQGLGYAVACIGWLVTTPIALAAFVSAYDNESKTRKAIK